MHLVCPAFEPNNCFPRKRMLDAPGYELHRKFAPCAGIRMRW